MASLLSVPALHCMPGVVQVALEKGGCRCCAPGCTVPACCCPCLQIWPALQQADACPDGICWLWPSITARSYQTAEILASTPLLNTGYRRIVPEYSFVSTGCYAVCSWAAWWPAAQQHSAIFSTLSSTELIVAAS